MLPIMASTFCVSSQVKWESQYTTLDLVIPVLNTCKKNLCVILKSEPLKSGG